MPKFKSKAEDEVLLFHADRVVAAGEVVEAKGELVEETDDAYVVDDGRGDLRAWPKANWELVVEPKPEPKGTSRKP